MHAYTHTVARKYAQHAKHSLAIVAFVFACGFAQGLLEQNHTRNFLRYFMLILLLNFSQLNRTDSIANFAPSAIN